MKISYILKRSPYPTQKEKKKHKTQGDIIMRCKFGEPKEIVMDIAINKALVKEYDYQRHIREVDDKELLRYNQEIQSNNSVSFMTTININLNIDSNMSVEHLKKLLEIIDNR